VAWRYANQQLPGNPLSTLWKRGLPRHPALSGAFRGRRMNDRQAHGIAYRRGYAQRIHSVADWVGDLALPQQREIACAVFPMSLATAREQSTGRRASAILKVGRVAYPAHAPRGDPVRRRGHASPIDSYTTAQKTLMKMQSDEAGFRPYAAGYDGVAKFLHWLVVLLIAAQFVIGWTMPDIHKGTRPDGLIAWHLGVGATLIAAVALRIIWRLTHSPAPAEVSPFLRVVSSGTHGLLYLALVAVPVLGWANASSRGWSVKLSGVLPYPAIAPVGSPVAHEMGDIHGYLAWVLFALIVLHVGGALFHRFVLKDRVLQRMLP